MVIEKSVASADTGAANMNEDVIRLLVADGDANVRDIVGFCARQEHWLCDEAKDGIAAIKLLRRKQYHLVILEAELPEIDGRLVCGQARKSTRVPIVFVSRRTAEEDRLAAFTAGGNDYLVKPFYPRELIARIKSLLTLCGISGFHHEEVICGAIRIEMLSHSVYVDNRPVQLTPKEYDLLLYFCQNPHHAFSRDALLDAVWGEQFYGTDRTVDTHIKSLREKIRPCHNTIMTVWGFGYKFEP